MQLKQKAKIAGLKLNNQSQAIHEFTLLLPEEITPLLFVHVTCICVLLFEHIPFVVNRTFNETSTPKLREPAVVLPAVNKTDSEKYR